MVIKIDKLMRKGYRSFLKPFIHVTCDARIGTLEILYSQEKKSESLSKNRKLKEIKEEVDLVKSIKCAKQCFFRVI